MPSDPPRHLPVPQADVCLTDAVPSPAQRIAWRRLWALLLADNPPNKGAPSTECASLNGGVTGPEDQDDPQGHDDDVGRKGGVDE
jgi:hypothetical protein